MCRTIGYQHFIKGLNSIENVTEYVPTLVITFNVTYHPIVKAGKSAVKRTVCLNIWVDNVVLIVECPFANLFVVCLTAEFFSTMCLNRKHITFHAYTVAITISPSR